MTQTYNGCLQVGRSIVCRLYNAQRFSLTLKTFAFFLNMFYTCNISSSCVMSCKFPLTTVSDRTCCSDRNLIVVSLLLRAVSDQRRFLETEGIVTEFSQTPQDAAKAEPSATRVRVQKVGDKRPLTSSCFSVRPSAWNTYAPAGRIFKSYYWGVLLDMLRKSEFAKKTNENKTCYMQTYIYDYFG
jgi:hypothetical protein